MSNTGVAGNDPDLDACVLEVTAYPDQDGDPGRIDSCQVGEIEQRDGRVLLDDVLDDSCGPDRASGNVSGPLMRTVAASFDRWCSTLRPLLKTWTLSMPVFSCRRMVWLLIGRRRRLCGLALRPEVGLRWRRTRDRALDRSSHSGNDTGVEDIGQQTRC